MIKNLMSWLFSVWMAIFLALLYGIVAFLTFRYPAFKNTFKLMTAPISCPRSANIRSRLVAWAVLRGNPSRMQPSRRSPASDSRTTPRISSSGTSAPASM